MAAVELASTSLFSDGNLVSYYKLENVNDSKGSNNLTNNGTTPFNAAKFNNGADFGNGNTTKSLTLASNMGIAGNGNFAISLWVKSYANPTAGNISSIFIHRSQTTANRFIQCYYYNNSGTFQLVLDNSIGFAGASKYNYTFDTSTFHNLVINRSTTTDSELWVDGIRVINALAQGSVVANNDDFQLANNGGTPSGQFIMDDAAIFNRVLNSTDINLINNGPSSAGTFMKPGGYW